MKTRKGLAIFVAFVMAATTFFSLIAIGVNDPATGAVYSPLAAYPYFGQRYTGTYTPAPGIWEYNLLDVAVDRTVTVRQPNYHNYTYNSQLFYADGSYSGYAFREGSYNNKYNDIKINLEYAANKRGRGVSLRFNTPQTGLYDFNTDLIGISANYDGTVYYRIMKGTTTLWPSEGSWSSMNVTTTTTPRAEIPPLSVFLNQGDDLRLEVYLATAATPTATVKVSLSIGSTSVVRVDTNTASSTETSVYKAGNYHPYSMLSAGSQALDWPYVSIPNRWNYEVLDVQNQFAVLPVNQYKGTLGNMVLNADNGKGNIGFKIASATEMQAQMKGGYGVQLRYVVPRDGKAVITAKSLGVNVSAGAQTYFRVLKGDDVLYPAEGTWASWSSSGGDLTLQSQVLSGENILIQAYTDSANYETISLGEPTVSMVVGEQTRYTITASAGSNGSVSPESASVAEGENQTFTITPDSGYKIDRITVDGEQILPSSDTFTFSNVLANHSIQVAFKQKPAVKILAIGNSYTENSFAYLKQLCDAGGIDYKLARLHYGGSTLEFHWSNINTQPPVYYYIQPGQSTVQGVSLRQALEYDDWDIITMQQVSNLSGVLSSYYPFIANLTEYIQSIEPQAEIVLHQTWAYQSGYGGLAGYGDQQGMFNALKSAYDSVSKDLGARLIPSGEAFQIARGMLGDTLNSDGTHANTKGQYLAGAVWYEVLTGENIFENPFAPPVSEVSPEDYAVLKQVAHEAVSRYNLERGITAVYSSLKTAYTVGQELDLANSKLTVTYQNGSSEQVNLTKHMVSGYDKSAIGTQTILVQYKGYTASYDVTVSEEASSSSETSSEPSSSAVSSEASSEPSSSTVSSEASSEPSSSAVSSEVSSEPSSSAVSSEASSEPSSSAVSSEASSEPGNSSVSSAESSSVPNTSSAAASSTQSSTVVEVTNGTGEVKVEIPQGALPANTTVQRVQITKISEESKSEIVAALQSGGYQNVLISDIQLIDQNNNPITVFNGKVKVKIAIPADVAGSNLKVLWYDSESGRLTDMQAVAEGDYLVFETDHFSYYVIAKALAGASSSDVGSPSTGDRSVMLAVLILAVSACGLLAVKKSRKVRV